MQPFDGEPFARPRSVEPAVPSRVEIDRFTEELAREGLAYDTPRFLPKWKSREGNLPLEAGLGREEKMLASLGRLLGLPPVRDAIEPAVSVLTPEELAATTSTVVDRNATALARNDRVEFVQRIVQAMRRARTEMPKTIEVEVHPPSLGRLKVQVVEHDGELTAKIQAHTTAARSLLLEHLPNLERQLGEHGVQIQRIQVDQMNTESSAQPDGQNAESGATAGEPGGGGRHKTWKEEPREEDLPAPLTISDLLSLVEGMDRLI